MQKPLARDNGIVARILELLRTSDDKGRLLELVLCDTLEDCGFFNISRQQSGSQFGFDVIAYRRHQDGGPEVWKFECKNVGAALTVGHLAPKLIYHLGSSTIEVFVIVSVLPMGNELRNLLERHDFPMRVEVWADEFLEAAILRSKKACARLGISQADVKEALIAPEIFPPRQTSLLDVVHELDPPLAFHYALTEGTVTKAYSQYGLRLMVIVSNRGRSDCLIHSLTMVTVEYRNRLGRIIVLDKPMGLFEPIEVIANPSIHPGSEVDVLNGKIWQIDANTTEALRLTLAQSATPGLYSVLLRARARVDGNAVTMSSVGFAFHILSEDDDVLRLKVAGRHYDSPIARILAGSTKEWKALKRHASRLNEFVYLGPTPVDVIKGVVDREWFVRSLPVRDDGPGRKVYSSDTPSRVIYSLGIPVDEELFSIDEARRQIAGNADMQGHIAQQIARRRRT